MKIFLFFLAVIVSLGSIAGILFQVRNIVVTGSVHTGLFFPVVSVTVLAVALWVFVFAVRRHGIEVLYTWRQK